MVRKVGSTGAPTPVADWPGPLDGLCRARESWAGLPDGPLVMGILNVTPDSFSDPGHLLDPARAIDEGRRMLAEGAAVLDVGGESTRPGAEPVPGEEEQRRVVPVITALVREGAVISVDTRNARTMARALDVGARIVNDVSALQHDREAAPLVARRGCPVILMHMRGTPATMNSLARYGDVGAEVLAELAQRVAAAEAAGIDPAAVAVDPGFGFAKNAAQSRELLQRLALFVNLRGPIIAGVSRKRFVGKMAGVDDALARGPGSIAAGLAALSQGASILRAHDVADTIQAIRVWRALNQ